MKNYNEKFEIVAEGISYNVNVHSYKNGADQLRFRVSVNESPVVVFGWDEKLGRFAILSDKRNPQIPTAAEIIIAHKLDHIPELKVAA